jgi:hypothetical protein
MTQFSSLRQVFEKFFDPIEHFKNPFETLIQTPLQGMRREQRSPRLWHSFFITNRVF